MAVVQYSDPLTEALRRYDLLTDQEVRMKQQAYALAGRSTTNPQLEKLRADILDLGKRIERLKARANRGGMRVRGAVPL